MYSTSETICGKWIDGKPIYRHVYHYNSLVTNIDVSSLHIDTLVDVKIVANKRLTKYIADATNYLSAVLLSDFTTLSIKTTITSLTDEIVIVEHTKRTD